MFGMKILTKSYNIETLRVKVTHYSLKSFKKIHTF